MKSKKIIEQLDVFRECRDYELPVWQCPQFLFLVMGILICAMAPASYLIGTRYVSDPALVALIVVLASGLLFVIDVLIVKSFENIAEANKMKSEFIGVVSHQLRSPLANFRWALEALKSGKMGQIEEGQLEYFKILKENTDRMLSLISDLLMVSKIQSADLPLEKESFSLDKRIFQIVEEFKAFSRASNVEVQVEKDKDVPKVFGDPKKIDLVVENLIDNAIRYTSGGGKVTVRLSKKKNKVLCEVKDKGVGIPKEDQKYIFQKFFRASNAAKERTDGSGLGLYIVKSIVERSGGKIWFDSEEGEGTTFFFTLPASKKK